MPNDIKQAILAAIAKTTDPAHQATLMLLFHVVETVTERVDGIADQLTVDADQHQNDHVWITAQRTGQSTVKSAAGRVLVSVLDKAVWALLVGSAAYFGGGKG